MRSSDIPEVKFQPTRFREGYNVLEVDAFLDVAENALREWEAGRAGQLLSDDVIKQRFSATRFRDGYDQDQVDDFLNKVMFALRGYEKNTTKY
ncbi:DivIVA domain-containing protein [Arthrobacter sp. UYCu511]|uniref:DivIVA domain-containing protein n=1 Tax=Arthrobacter sp. UYCu511 TaxID=3156337 RepID=UPI00339604E6